MKRFRIMTRAPLYSCSNIYDLFDFTFFYKSLGLGSRYETLTQIGIRNGRGEATGYE